MDNFSISELQQLSGIKAHTIRIWEQRYNALTPHRSEGNTRFYDNDHLKRLLNIVSLLEDGYKISQLGTLSDEELHALLAEKIEHSGIGEDNNEYFVSQLISAAMSYDELRFQKLFNECIQEQGLTNTYNKILYPMLKRMGLMWDIDSISPAQEHFSSNLIKQKIYAAIEALPDPTSQDKKWLLFLPENEFHEIALIFSNYIIQEAGQPVIYLGSNVPFKTLEKAAEDTQATDLLFFFVHHIDPEKANTFIQTLSKSFKKVKIHFAGNTQLIGQLSLPKNVNWIRTPEDLMTVINA